MSAVQLAVSCSTQLNNPMFPLHLLHFVNIPFLGTAGVKLRHTAASSGHLIRDNHRPVSPQIITQTAGTISQASHSHYTVQYSTGTVQYSTGLAHTLHSTVQYRYSTVQYSTGLALTLHVTRHTGSAKTQAVSNIERLNQ